MVSKLGVLVMGWTLGHTGGAAQAVNQPFPAVEQRRGPFGQQVTRQEVPGQAKAIDDIGP